MLLQPTTFHVTVNLASHVFRHVSLLKFGKAYNLYPGARMEDIERLSVAKYKRSL